MRFWFTSDTHFQHQNIIEYCNRPFKTLEDMDETIIRNWNERVAEEDTVFHLGDFCFRNSSGGKPGEGAQSRAKSYEDRLNGTIVRIRGNHDNNNSAKSVITSMTIYHGGYDISLVHNPEHAKDGMLNLCGHVHNRWKFRSYTANMHNTKTNIVNVGVDVWKFMPISINEIMREFTTWQKEIQNEGETGEHRTIS